MYLASLADASGFNGSFYILNCSVGNLPGPPGPRRDGTRVVTLADLGNRGHNNRTLT